jgi:hypothetical protein
MTEEDRRFAETDYYTEREIANLGGMGIFTWLTEKPTECSDEVWKLFCHCSESGGKELRGWGYDDELNIWVHANCGLPKATNAILFECYSCEDYFRSPRLPERTFVCPECLAYQAAHPD